MDLARESVYKNSLIIAIKEKSSIFKQKKVRGDIHRSRIVSDCLTNTNKAKSPPTLQMSNFQPKQLEVESTSYCSIDKSVNWHEHILVPLQTVHLKWNQYIP